MARSAAATESQRIAHSPPASGTPGSRLLREDVDDAHVGGFLRFRTTRQTRRTQRVGAEAPYSRTETEKDASQAWLPAHVGRSGRAAANPAVGGPREGLGRVALPRIGAMASRLWLRCRRGASRRLDRSSTEHTVAFLDRSPGSSATPSSSRAGSRDAERPSGELIQHAVRRGATHQRGRRARVGARVPSSRSQSG